MSYPFGPTMTASPPGGRKAIPLPVPAVPARFRTAGPASALGISLTGDGEGAASYRGRAGAEDDIAFTGVSRIIGGGADDVLRFEGEGSLDRIDGRDGKDMLVRLDVATTFVARPGSDDGIDNWRFAVRDADGAVRLATATGIGRAYNEIVKRIFDERGIEIPLPHQTVYFGERKDGSTQTLHFADDSAQTA